MDAIRSPATRTAGGQGHTPFGILRVVLALLVVFQHAVAGFHPGAVVAGERGFEAGSIAVLVFFVLSGHIIDEAADLVYRGRPWAFLLNRLLRILPTYFVGIAAFLIVAAALHGAGYGLMPVEGRPLVPADLWSPRLLLANLGAVLPIPQSLPWIAEEPRLMLIIWAVRVEMMFYLAFFALLVVAKASGIAVGRVLSVAGVLAIAAALPGLLGGHDTALTNAPFFVLGVAHRRLRAAAGDRATVGWAGALFAAALALSLWKAAGLGVGLTLAQARFGEAALFLGLLTVFAGLTGLRIDPTSLATRIDQKAGELTYPIYIDHMTAISALGLMVAGRSTALVGVAIVAGILFSWAIAAVSEPAIARLRDRVRGRRLR